MGRHAMLAKVVVDTTGDGDMFARAGAEFDTDIEEGDVHHSMNTGWVLGGVRHGPLDRLEGPRSRPVCASSWPRGREELGFFQTPYVSWRPDIALVAGAAPVGPLGARRRRHDRARNPQPPPDGRPPPVLPQARAGLRERLFAAERAASSACGTRGASAASGGSSARTGATAPRRRTRSASAPRSAPSSRWSRCPTAALVPRALDGMLAAGRHVSCDANSHGFMREIPQCWLTGHAAGVGAAVAANRGVQPRAVDVGRSARDPA